MTRQFALGVLLGIDITGHAISLYLRSQGMEPMWVTQAQPVDVPRQSTGDPEFQVGSWSPRPQWRCPVHGDFSTTFNVILAPGEGPHHYCPRCLVDMLDRNVPQVEAIPQAEEGAR